MFVGGGSRWKEMEGNKYLKEKGTDKQTLRAERQTEGQTIRRKRNADTEVDEETGKEEKEVEKEGIIGETSCVEAEEHGRVIKSHNGKKNNK